MALARSVRRRRMLRRDPSGTPAPTGDSRILLGQGLQVSRRPPRPAARWRHAARRGRRTPGTPDTWPDALRDADFSKRAAPSGFGHGKEGGSPKTRGYWARVGAVTSLSSGAGRPVSPEASLRAESPRSPAAHTMPGPRAPGRKHTAITTDQSSALPHVPGEAEGNHRGRHVRVAAAITRV